MLLDLGAYVLFPFLFFAAIGFILSGRKRRISTWLMYLVLAIGLHWALTFLGVRVLRI
ncbi:hypothetical protein [Caballeronia sp. NK8]|uniref:hypothetical protein n=1 Tax=Caballeronia sp. NK8 TaxID=140098 RepID=UPI001BCF45F5|nr:hypothetical protein [Caballeronia sp. NK8]